MKKAAKKQTAKKQSAKKKAAKAQPAKALPAKAPRSAGGEEHLARVRALCLSLPETTEKISHGEPTFFVKKRVYCMFAKNHHHDGHIAVWIAAAPGVQAELIRSEPAKYFRPPYVGVGGWVGIELTEIGDDELAAHLLEAWKIIKAKQSKPR
jgi:hypothetical protein